MFFHPHDARFAILYSLFTASTKLSRQAPCGAAVDQNVGKLPDQLVAACKAHQSAAVGAGSEQLAVSAVNQHAQGLADIGAVLFLGNTVLHGAQPVKAAVFVGFGERIRPRGEKMKVNSAS